MEELGYTWKESMNSKIMSLIMRILISVIIGWCWGSVITEIIQIKKKKTKTFLEFELASIVLCTRLWTHLEEFHVNFLVLRIPLTVPL